MLFLNRLNSKYKFNRNIVSKFNNKIFIYILKSQFKNYLFNKKLISNIDLIYIR